MPSSRVFSALLLAMFAVGPLPGQTPGYFDLLNDSIAFHDPGGTWPSGAFRLAFEESRPDGSVRETRILIDNRASRFEVEWEREGRRVEGSLTDADCEWRLDGSTEFSAEEKEAFRLTCDRLEWVRNYYVYLWGMPMKLRDPGTLIDDTVIEADFEGRRAWQIRVTYDAEVGSDVWYFYFDPETRALIGYRFFHDEAAYDGEYVLLDGLEEGAGLRLPKNRTWYTHQGGELLGTDTVIGIESAH